MPKSLNLPIQRRTLEVVPNSLNLEERTVEVVFSTGARVRRLSWEGSYDEELSLDPKHVNLARFQSGRAAVLDDHGFGLGVHGRNLGRIGVIESAETDGKRGTAKIRFSSRPEVEPILRDLAEGVLGPVSVGYQVRRMKEVSERGAKIPTYRAIDWEPHEISLVSVEADPGASVRSQDDTPTVRCVIENNRNESQESEPMPEPAAPEQGEVTEVVDTPAPAPAPAPDLDQIRAQAIKDERTRQTKIRNLVGSYSHLGIAQESAQELIDEGLTLEQAQLRLLEDLRASQPKPPTGADPVFSHGPSEIEKVRDGAQNLIYRKFGLDVDGNLLNDGSDFQGWDMSRMAEEYLRRSGDTTRYAPGSIELFNAAFRSSGSFAGPKDFSVLLQNAMHKTMMASYEINVGTWERWSRQVTAKDFRPMIRLFDGEAGLMKQIAAGDEYETYSFGQRAESFSVLKYGEAFDYTWEMMVDDDVGVLQRLLSNWGASARAKKSDIVWLLVTNNYQLADGVGIFDSTRGNQTGGNDRTSFALDDDSLNDIFVHYRTLTGLNDSTAARQNAHRIRVTPKTLVVPPQLWRKATKLVRQETAPEAFESASESPARSDMNVWRGLMDVVVEERLLDMPASTGKNPEKTWYCFGDGPGITHFEHAVLEGEGDAPKVTREEVFNRDAFRVKARIVFGAHAPEYRGFFRGEEA